MKMIGLFWYIPAEDRFICEKYSLDDELKSPENEYCTFITAKSAHFLLWELRRGSYPYEYNHFPRGRVNYLVSSGEYELDMDRCLQTDEIIGKLIEEFELDADKIKIVPPSKNSTGHYTCYQCR